MELYLTEKVQLGYNRGDIGARHHKLRRSVAQRRNCFAILDLTR